LKIRAFSLLLKCPPDTIWPFKVLISLPCNVLFNQRYRLQFQLHFLRKSYQIQFKRNAESDFIESQIAYPPPNSHAEDLVECSSWVDL
jgi:hypothetical protein